MTYNDRFPPISKKKLLVEIYHILRCSLIFSRSMYTMLQETRYHFVFIFGCTHFLSPSPSPLTPPSSWNVTHWFMKPHYLCFMNGTLFESEQIKLKTTKNYTYSKISTSKNNLPHVLKLKTL